jgi:hypothetical protein
VKTRTEEPIDPKKKVKKKDRRRKEEEPTVKIGIDIEAEGLKVQKRRPKRDGCKSGGSSGVGGSGLKVGFDVDVEPGGGKEKYEVVVVRPIKAGAEIGPDDVEERKVSKKGRGALDKGQVVGKRASRTIDAGETMRRGMTK